jgi:alpha-glucosidase
MRHLNIPDMRRINLHILCSLVLAAQAEAIDLTSPDGIVHCLISTNAEGHLLYSVSQGGQQRLAPEKLGVIVDQVDLGAKVTLGEPQARSISEVFPWRGNKTAATNSCRAAEIPVRTQAGLDWVLETRVFDDGVGFRYRVPGTGLRQIQGESTGWQLPKDCAVWFQTDTVNYEGAYQSSSAE